MVNAIDLANVLATIFVWGLGILLALAVVVGLLNGLMSGLGAMFPPGRIAVPQQPVAMSRKEWVGLAIVVAIVFSLMLVR